MVIFIVIQSFQKKFCLKYLDFTHKFGYLRWYKSSKYVNKFKIEPWEGGQNIGPTSLAW